jgi:predicted Zn-dependent peptidase
MVAPFRSVTANGTEILIEPLPHVRSCSVGFWVRRGSRHEGSANRSPDRAAAHLLSHVLGGGMASRLFMELRERRGLCYQVGSYLTPYTDSGALQISASCAPAQLRELVQRTMAED